MQFNRNNLPSDIIQAHRALYRLGAALAVGYPGEFFVDIDGETSPIVDMHWLIDGCGTRRFYLMAAFELETDYLALPGFDWEKLKPIEPKPFTIFYSATPTPNPIPDPTPDPTPDPSLVINGSTWSSYEEDGIYIVVRPYPIEGPIYSISLINTICTALLEKYGTAMDYDSYFVGDNGIFYSFYIP